MSRTQQKKRKEWIKTSLCIYSSWLPPFSLPWLLLLYFYNSTFTVAFGFLNTPLACVKMQQMFWEVAASKTSATVHGSSLLASPSNKNVCTQSLQKLPKKAPRSQNHTALWVRVMCSALGKHSKETWHNVHRGLISKAKKGLDTFCRSTLRQDKWHKGSLCSSDE